jgi:alpha-1,3-mannosyltransferase
VRSIFDFEIDSSPGFERVSCPSKIGPRDSPLRDQAASSGQVRYFFALNLHQSTGIIFRLMSSIVEAIRFLGAEHCATSIVEGRSDYRTYEILAALQMHVEAMGAQLFLSTGNINQKQKTRTEPSVYRSCATKPSSPSKSALPPTQSTSCLARSHQMRLSFHH